MGFSTTGIDSNHRAVFFGPEGDTSWVLGQLRAEIPDYTHKSIDIRDREAVVSVVDDVRPNLIIHTAAQPSHDRAAAIPFLDFEVNALGTLHILEAARQFCPEAPFIHMSTNKVYGDRPNTISLKELDTRWDYADPAYAEGIPESFSIDQSSIPSSARRRLRRTSWSRNTDVISTCPPAACAADASPGQTTPA